MKNKPLIEDGYEIIEDDFGVVVYEEPSDEPVVPETSIQSPPTDAAVAKSLTKSPGRLVWETRNPKIYAIVEDPQGQQLEIRKVNRNKQLGFWNDNHNALNIVHEQKDHTFESKDMVFKRK